MRLATFECLHDAYSNEEEIRDNALFAFMAGRWLLV
jgi:hypothetical protein